MKLGTVSLDGTKVQANASRHKALSWEYANRLETQLQAEVDVPAELKRREDRLAAIRAAKAEKEARAAREEQTGRRSDGKPPSPPRRWSTMAAI